MRGLALKNYIPIFYLNQSESESIDLIESKRGKLYQFVSKLYIFAVADIVGSRQK